MRKRLQLRLAAVCGVLTGVLAGAVHGRHPGALLTGGRLLQGQVDDVDQSKLLVVPQHVGIDVVVDAHVLCTRDKDTLNICPTGGEKQSKQNGNATRVSHDVVGEQGLLVRLVGDDRPVAEKRGLALPSWRDLTPTPETSPT